MPYVSWFLLFAALLYTTVYQEPIMYDSLTMFRDLQNETLIAIKAPHGTTLEVPDPDEVG
jgi:hypothetical protein